MRRPRMCCWRFMAVPSCAKHGTPLAAPCGCPAARTHPSVLRMWRLHHLHVVPPPLCLSRLLLRSPEHSKVLQARGRKEVSPPGRGGHLRRRAASHRCPLSSCGRSSASLLCTRWRRAEAALQRTLPWSEAGKQLAGGGPCRSGRRAAPALLLDCLSLLLSLFAQSSALLSSLSIALCRSCQNFSWGATVELECRGERGYNNSRGGRGIGSVGLGGQALGGESWAGERDKGLVGFARARQAAQAAARAARRESRQAGRGAALHRVYPSVLRLLFLCTLFLDPLTGSAPRINGGTCRLEQRRRHEADERGEGIAAN